MNPVPRLAAEARLQLWLCILLFTQSSLALQGPDITYRWAYRNPLSITNASATDTGEGSFYGTVNSLSNAPQPGTMALRYSHGGTFGTLPNGSLAAIWQGSPQYLEGSSSQAAYWSLSNDSGTTWGPATLIYSLPNGPLWGPQIHVEGSIVWMFFSGTAPTACTYSQSGGTAWPPGGDLQVVMSENNGQTWGDPVVIAPLKMDGGSGKLNVGRVAVNKAGDWLLPFWRERSGPTPPCWGSINYNNYTGVPGVYQSQDKGASWHLLGNAIVPSSAASVPPTSWLIEAAIAPFEAGNRSGILQVFRSNTSTIWQSTSLDDGVTWSPAQPGSLMSPNSKSDIISLPDASLLVAYNNNPSARTDLTVARSSDGGVTWNTLAVLETGNGQYSYPTLTYLANGDVAVVYSVWQLPSNLSVATVGPSPAIPVTVAPPPQASSPLPGVKPSPQPPAGRASPPPAGRAPPPPSGRAPPPPVASKTYARSPSGLVSITAEETAGRRLSQLLGSRRLLRSFHEDVPSDLETSTQGGHTDESHTGRELLQVPFDQGAWGYVSYGIRVASFNLQEALDANTAVTTAGR